MPKIMLVNVTHVEETRVAVLDDGVLAAYEIETLNRTHIKGNIHNAVVESIHPSLEASFVRIGPDLKGFLPIDEVNFRLLPARSESRKSGRIGQHLHPGQKIMAQVVREPFAGKPPTVSTYFSLPGRFLVLMPGVESSGISRKIEDSAQRERLKTIVDELSAPEGFGVIVRTAGLGQNKTELQRDLRYLLRLWESIQRASHGGDFPSLVYREADLVIRTIRDHLTSDISEVWIDSEETYEKALAFVGDVMPTRAKTLKLYTGERPLFNKFNLEEQIERIYKRRVPLPSGGEIVIDGTEALTAVDVNTARSRRSADLEETVTQTNTEAATEIARQLRLRDLGGLVVIDFIDMMQARNKKKVEKVMRDALRGDRAKHDVTVISKLGLMEIARQRLKGAKMASSYATCPTCDGHGLIKNVETASLSLMRKLQSRVAHGDAGRLRVAVPPEVASWVLNNKRDALVHLEQRHNVTVEIESKPNLLRHECEFVAFPREKSEEPRSKPAADPVTAAGEARNERGGGQQGPAITPKEQPDGPGASATAGREQRPASRGETPTAARESTEETAGPASPPAPAEGATGGSGPAEQDGTTPRPRRRRRARRRRSGAAGGPAAEPSPENPGAPPAAADAPSTPEQPKAPASVEVVVPRNIRSDELMPAASGGGRSSKRRSSGGGSTRRRRRSPAKAGATPGRAGERSGQGED